MALMRAIFVLLMLAGCASAGTIGAANGTAAAEGGDLRKAARDQMGELAHAASAYGVANNQCAQSIDQIASPAPVDPWGNPIALMNSPESGTAFVSGGPDGQLLTEDDITVGAPCSE